MIPTDLRAGEGLHRNFVQADLLDHETIGVLIDDVDVIVHLGNHPGIGTRPPQVVFAENVTMNANVFQAAAEASVGRIVFAGTLQLVGSHVDRRTVVTDPVRPQYPLDGATIPDPSNLYALSKAMSEAMLAYYARRCEIGVTILRFPLLHDNGDSVGVRSGQETATDVLEGFTGLTYADAARAVASVVDADLGGYRVYSPARSHRHRELDLRALAERFYPELVDGPLEPIDWSALTDDTGWRPSDDYGDHGVVPAAETAGTEEGAGS